MKYTFDFECETNSGDLFECEVTYKITPYRAGDYYTPPEGGDIEIISIKKDGNEVDVEDYIFDAIATCAEDHANDNYNDPYDNEYDEE